MAQTEIVTQIDTSTGKPGKSVETKDDVIVKVVGEESSIEVEVQDDTPPKDKNRRALEKEPELGVADDDTVAEEIDKYNEKAKRQIKELRHGYHDERRAKEAALREREEAINLVKQAFGEVDTIRKRQDQERAAFIKELKEKAEAEITSAKHALKQAHETGTADEFVAAQSALNKAQINQEVLNRWTPPPPTQTLQKENTVVEQRQVTKQQVPDDPAAEEWAETNPWFGTDKRMTSFAFGVHEELISQGVDPKRNADKYYKAINAAMRETFPKYEWEDADEKSQQSPTKKKETKATTVVAPVQRTTRGTKVTLTTTQVSLAKRLGLTPEQYARELAKTLEA